MNDKKRMEELKRIKKIKIFTSEIDLYTAISFYINEDKIIVSKLEKDFKIRISKKPGLDVDIFSDEFYKPENSYVKEENWTSLKFFAESNDLVIFANRSFLKRIPKRNLISSYYPTEWDRDKLHTKKIYKNNFISDMLYLYISISTIEIDTYRYNGFLEYHKFAGNKKKLYSFPKVFRNGKYLQKITGISVTGRFNFYQPNKLFFNFCKEKIFEIDIVSSDKTMLDYLKGLQGSPDYIVGENAYLNMVDEDGFLIKNEMKAKQMFYKMLYQNKDEDKVYDLINSLKLIGNIYYSKQEKCYYFMNYNSDFIMSTTDKFKIVPYLLQNLTQLVINTIAIYALSFNVKLRGINHDSIILQENFLGIKGYKEKEMLRLFERKVLSKLGIEIKLKTKKIN